MYDRPVVSLVSVPVILFARSLRNVPGNDSYVRSDLRLPRRMLIDLHSVVNTGLVVGGGILSITGAFIVTRIYKWLRGIVEVHSIVGSCSLVASRSLSMLHNLVQCWIFQEPPRHQDYRCSPFVREVDVVEVEGVLRPRVSYSEMWIPHDVVDGPVVPI